MVFFYKRKRIIVLKKLVTKYKKEFDTHITKPKLDINHFIEEINKEVEEINREDKGENVEEDEINREDEGIINNIYFLFGKEKLYTNKLLTAELLAEKLNVNRKVVSSITLKYFNMNFSSLLNYYRIEEAMRLLIDPMYENYKIEYLYSKVGFSTKQSFYSVFKQYTGLTPIAFKEKMNNNKGI